MTNDGLPELPDIEQEIYSNSRRYIPDDACEAVGEMMQAYARAAIAQEREAWRKEVETCLRAAGLTEGMARGVAAAIRGQAEGERG